MNQPGTSRTKKPQQQYAAFTPLMALQLAAPHTWPAAILPVLFATALAALNETFVSLSMVFALLVICILMQSSVNTLNDYFDYVKGTDRLENQDDPTDAVLVYNNINPKAALWLTIAFLCIGLCIGMYVVWVAGWIPLVIGLIGAAILIVYSVGKTPISYLPLGELISGFTMGGLIPLASYQALTGTFDLVVLLLSIPYMIGIALIMFTNNTCDIEKDIEATRKTLAVINGRDKARMLYHAKIIIWIAFIIVFTAIFFTAGLLVMPFMLLILYPVIQALYNNPLEPKTRGQAMGQILNLNIGLGLSYIVAFLLSGSLIALL